MDGPNALSIPDFAKMFGISVPTVWRYASYGKLRVIKVGGRTVVPPSEVARVDREGLGVVGVKAGAEMRAANETLKKAKQLINAA